MGEIQSDKTQWLDGQCLKYTLCTVTPQLGFAQLNLLEILIKLNKLQPDLEVLDAYGRRQRTSLHLETVIGEIQHIALSITQKRLKTVFNDIEATAIPHVGFEGEVLN